MSRTSPRPLRLLHVIDSLHLGGAEQLLLTLARHIDADRFDMRVCTLSPDDVATPISVALQAANVPVYRAPRLRRHDLRHVPWLAKLMRRQAIGVVHTHLAYGNTIGLLAARRPAVATIHSVNDRHRGLPAVKRALQGAALRTASVVLACSPEVETSARKRFRLRSAKVVVLPNGIDLAPYAGDDPGNASDRRRDLLDGMSGPLVLSVGRLNAQKGHRHLVEATIQLVERFPGLRVVIVGGDGDNGALVRERITAGGLQGHIALAGERGDVPALLAAADLFVLPSLWEGVPLALLEAMAAGVPVVASAVGGVWSASDQGRLARLVPPGDPDALSEAMAELLADPARGREVARQAAVHVRARYDARAWARALERIYTELAARATTSP